MIDTKVESRIYDIDPPRASETNEDFCDRLFDGEKFSCRHCKTEIQWKGVCDKCHKIVNIPDKPLPDQWLDAGIPKLKLDYSWKLVEMPRNSGISIAKLRDWKGKPPFITIHGSVGSGKTGAGICMVKDWIGWKRFAKFVYLPSWLDDLRFLEGEGSSHLESMRVVRYSGLLVCDELVTERKTDFVKDKILQLIDGRDGAGLPTVFTSNLPLMSKTGKSIAGEYGARTASRLQGGIVIEWKGPDRRVR